MKFTYQHSLVDKEDIQKNLKELENEMKRMQFVVATQNLEDDRASIVLPDQKITDLKKVIDEKVKLKPEYIVVVGIGGSNLGTIAVQEAVLGKLYNQTTKGTKILYADTTDNTSMQAIIEIIEPVLKKKKNVIINGISKSGGTTETLANFQVLVNLVKKYKKDYQKLIVVTTGEGSTFWELAERDGFTALSIPPKVGGRYSVFSPVGLFPLGILGLKIQQLLKGAKDIRSDCTKRNNIAAISASIIFEHFKNGKNIADHFLFANNLESTGKWYRQLMGESIGKEHNTAGEQVCTGITPTVSIGSTDLHSMAQMYLGGPHDKYSLFVTVNKLGKDYKVPKMKGYLEMIQGKPFSEIMRAIQSGIQIAFKKGKRPFCEIQLDELNEYEIGQLLQFKMIEMMYLGVLMNVNPFDQPNVEQYKIETKKILSK